MALDFAISCSLVRPGRPHIRFLSIGSRLCSTLPPDPASQRCPCASLALQHHPSGQRTLTSKLSNMLGTQLMGTSRCEVPRSRAFRPASVRTEVCGPGRRSQTLRTSLRSARPLHRRMYRSVDRYTHPRNRCPRSSFARLHTADHRQFRPSKDRYWRLLTRALVAHWRCRQTANARPAEGRAISRRTPVACRRTG